MSTSIDTLPPGQPAAALGSTRHTQTTKPLWAAVGILGVAVAGLGGTLLYQQRASVAPPAPVATAAALSPAPRPAAPAQASPNVSRNAADDLSEKPALAPAQPAPAPAKKVVKHVAKPAPAPAYSGVSPAPVAGAAPNRYPPAYASPAPVTAAPVCAVCGSVESVTPVERSSKPAGVGVGTVAGGVLGAVLGNQVGHGNGRTAATILGAVGGGFAGNAIEGKMRRETVYQVGVRMEDGSRRMVEVAHAPGVGSPVTVEGSTLRTRDGATYSPKPRPAPVSAQPTVTPEYQRP
ncbi:MAG: glycine zipper 2TM domain-containing protein [Polaromonas sp.]